MKVTNQLKVIEDNVKGMSEEKASIIFFKTYLAIKDELIALEQRYEKTAYLKGVIAGMNKLKK